MSLAYKSCIILRLHQSNKNQIGAVAESSAKLSKTITQLIPRIGPPKRILEVGAGTGVFTAKLVEKLNPHDHLDIVELTPELCEILHEKFDHIPNANIFCGDILQFSSREPYDYIISGLPFNSFTAPLVTQISQKYLELVRPGALCAFFEYKWLPKLRTMSLADEERKAFLATRTAILGFVAQHEMFSSTVYLNLPPAIVHFLRLKK